MGSRLRRGYRNCEREHPMIVTSDSLSNSDIAELLAMAAETAKMPLQKALRRASRKALFWEEEVAVLLEQSRSLAEELPGVGTSLDRIIRRWIDDPPEVPKPPELRRNFLTLTEARAILANSSLSRVYGDLQMHTVWSDGSGTIEEMARAAIDRGYEYIAITDHSKGLRIAGGINEQQLVQQSLEIEEVNSTFKAEARTFRVLRSIELNLDPRGDGDMESPSLRKLDVVLGCFHSALRKKEDQTERYLAALRNPHIQILGHPRGRIYNFRSGLMAHWERVFDLAAELDKAVEIDAYPDRQDLSLDLVMLARKAGCRISLGTDAHDPAQLRFMEYALASTEKAGMPRERVLNCMDANQLSGWAAGIRDRFNSAA